ncbi:MAG TPA: CARDB domain-containing protein [Chloroflexota bacterium]|jgi:WD40 repeat protein
MRTSHLRRSAALALGLALLVAGAVAPAALAYTPGPDDLPDLTVSLTTSVASSSTNLSEPGGPVTYYLTIKNPSIQVWDAEMHRYYTGGAPASGVMVRDWLPDGSQFLSASADSGFSCSYAYGVVTCTGGALANGGTAHITINTKAPPLMAQYWTAATADPNNTIAERNENNNTKVITLNVLVLN